MGLFFIYSIKLAFCLTAFYLLYKLLLSRDTFHAFNRAALLGLIALSLLLPLVRVQLPVSPVTDNGMIQIEHLIMQGAVSGGGGTGGISLMQTLMIAYAAGVVFFLLRELLSLRSLLALMRSGRRVSIGGGVRLTVIDGDVLPFSWFRNIIISERDYNGNPREILTHEKAHIARCHSVDVLLCDVLTTLQWFNPAAWLLKAELQAVHEYEADEAVLASGINASDYQLLLIRKAVGDRLYAMANNFNHNSLKRRIAMMLTKKSNPWNRAKLLLTVPVAAVAVTAFATEKAESVSSEIAAESSRLFTEVVTQSAGQAVTGADASAGSVTAGMSASEKAAGAPEAKGGDDGEKVFDVVEVPPSFPGGPMELIKFLQQNIKYPVEAAEKKVQGRVVVKFVINKDGSVSDVSVMKSVSPELDTEAVRVVKAMPKWEPGRQKGKTVNVRYVLPVTFRLDGGKPSVQTKAASAPNLSESYIVVDGKRVSAAELGKISPDNIERVEVLKGNNAVEKYGEAAANGAIVVTLKKQ